MNGFVRTLAAALTALLGVSGMAVAAEEAGKGVDLSGNVTIATDYRFRGVSQLDNSPAIQGGFDFSTDPGFYVGTWASNIGFAGDGSQIELDLYAGFSSEINDKVSYDVGYLYYWYPKDDSDPNLDYYEIYGSLSFHDATVGLNYSPDYFAETDNYYYLYGDYGLKAFDDRLGVDFHIGWNKFKNSKQYNAFFGSSSSDDGYADWSLKLSTEYANVEWALTYVDTSVSDNDCKDLCDPTVVVSLSKSL